MYTPHSTESTDTDPCSFCGAGGCAGREDADVDAAASCTVTLYMRAPLKESRPIIRSERKGPDPRKAEKRKAERETGYPFSDLAVRMVVDKMSFIELPVIGHAGHRAGALAGFPDLPCGVRRAARHAHRRSEMINYMQTPGRPPRRML